MDVGYNLSLHVGAFVDYNIAVTVERMYVRPITANRAVTPHPRMSYGAGKHCFQEKRGCERSPGCFCDLTCIPRQYGSLVWRVVKIGIIFALVKSRGSERLKHSKSAMRGGLRWRKPRAVGSPVRAGRDDVVQLRSEAHQSGAEDLPLFRFAVTVLLEKETASAQVFGWAWRRVGTRSWRFPFLRRALGTTRGDLRGAGTSFFVCWRHLMRIRNY